MGLPTPPSDRAIYISSEELDINGWSDNGLIAGGAIDPTNIKFH